jgi:peroxiredoxin
VGRLIAVKDFVPVAQVVEAIEVRAAMSGHQYGVIIESRVLRGAGRREVFDLDSAGCVRHPHVVRGIAHTEVG